MKTAISIPDLVFHRVDEQAKILGISRSELLSKAATHYLDHLAGESVTARINAVIDEVGQDETDLIVAEYNQRRLAALPDEDW